MTNQTKPRYEFIDLMKGICITLVVLYHSHIEFIDNCFLLTTFRMPLYFILSGMFFKPYSSYKEFTLKKVNSLIIPFLFTIIAYNVTTNIYRYLCGEYIAFLLVTPSMWFLFCLFQVGLIYYLISLSNNLIVETIICYALSILGFYLSTKDIELPLFFSASLSSVIFYHYGSLIKRLKVLTPQSQKYSFLNLLIWLSIFLTIGLLSPLNKLDLHHNHYPSNFIVTQILAISGTMSILYISKIINRIPLISYWGRYSIIILCTHNIYMRIFEPIIHEHNTTLFKLSSFVIVMLLSIPTIYILNKYLPFVYGQQPFFSTITSSRLYKKLVVSTVKSS